MIRLLCSLGVGLQLAAVSLSFAKSDRAEAQVASLAVVSSMDKYRPDQSPSSFMEAVELHAARGEAESAQILVMASVDQALKSVTASVAPLKNAAGDTLSVKLSRVGYVNIPLVTPDGYGEPGDYPDILLPLENFSLEAGRNQSLWLTAWVPQDAKPGLYQGEVVVSTEGKLVGKVPVSVRVYSTVLPRQSFLTTAFGYGPWNMEKPHYYGKGWTGSVAEEDFLRMMIDYRMTPANSDIGGTVRALKDTFSKDGSGKWQANWAAFDQEVAKRLEEGWTCFQIAHIPLNWYKPDTKRNLTQVVNRWGTSSPDDQAQVLRLLNDHLVEKGWAERFIFKCFDEPSINAHNAQLLRDFAKFFQENAPALRLFMITTDCRERGLAKDEPVFAWVPHLPSLYLNPGYEEFLAERQKVGEPAWTYICDTRTRSADSYRFPDIAPIDRTGTSQRCLGLLAWRNRLDGFLYWNVSEWDAYGGYDNPKHKTKGEGVLFYPDRKDHGAPFPSLRAELVRDGFEDHDLLYLLDRQIKALERERSSDEEKSQILKKAREVLDVADLIPNLRDFNKDSAAYEKHHRLVLEMLEETRS